MKRVLVPAAHHLGGLHAFSQNIAPALRDLGWEQVLVVPHEATEVIERLTGSGTSATLEQLAGDAQARKALGSALRQRVHDDFSAQSVARIHAEAYQAAIAS